MRALSVADQMHTISINDALRRCAQRTYLLFARGSSVSPSHYDRTVAQRVMPSGDYVPDAFADTVCHPRCCVHAWGDFQHRRSKEAAIACLNIDGDDDGHGLGAY